MSLIESSPVERLRVETATFLRTNGAGATGLQGRFHSHITVRVADEETLAHLRTFCRACRVKLTVVELADFAGRSQRDVMVTRYFQVDCEDAVARIIEDLATLSERIDRLGMPVLRVKLEHESLPTLAHFSRHQYREIHIKLHLPENRHAEVMEQLKTAMQPLGGVPSRNPYERIDGVVVQFVNFRFYEGDLASTEKRIEHAVTLLEQLGAEIADVKRETTVFDTNQGHDRWWA